MQRQHQTESKIAHMQDQAFPSSQPTDAAREASGTPYAPYAPYAPVASGMSVSDVSRVKIAAPSLTTALQSTMLSPQKRQRVIIPGAAKRASKKAHTTISTRSLAPRLRVSIVLAIVLLLFGTALLSFAPLGSGQGSFTLFARVSSWVQSQQTNWSVQAQVAQPGVANSNTTAPVAMTLPKSQYVAIAEQDAGSAGIPPQYFVRQINLESGFNPAAHSPSGAVGIAQFMPATAAGLGINPWDPVAALRAAARLMASYAQSFGGDYAKALAAYNSGSATVNHAIASCGASWINCLPAETQHYIATIMGT